MNSRSISILLGIVLCSFTNAQDQKLIDFVDPFIGTGGHGHTYPGASMPFGMMQLSPDTRLEGWDGCSAYHFTDSVVYGFSHTHLSGTGVSDYGDILFMPTTGELQWDNGYKKSPDEGYASRFDKNSEKASPGHYSVDLKDYGIKVDLTSNLRSGIHKYTFPKSKEARIIVDLKHRDPLISSFMRIASDTEIEGYRISKAWAREQHVYFVAKFSKPFRKSYLNENDTVSESLLVAEGEVKGAFEFKTKEGEVIYVKVGISAVSLDGARKNLYGEIGSMEFEDVLKNAEESWESELSKIKIEASKDQKVIFYTALYHSLLNPNLFSDVDGKYMGMDLKIHHSDHKVYTVFSLWDTFRATHPLFTIIDQQRTNEFINTFLKQYRDGGQLPIWELCGNYTGCMIGYHSIPVIVDAYMKGIRDYDINTAYEAMRHSAMEDKLGLDAYKEFGYIPMENEGESVSKTLEYAYDDWCIGEMAREIGNEEDYELFNKRGLYYINVFDPNTGFMRGKRNEMWSGNFRPNEVNFNFTEANSWQYSFFVPQDISGLMAAMGGKQAFLDKLDGLFTADSKTSGREQADITGLIGQYAHGNEPSHHMAYLYNYANQPWKTQQRVRQIMDELYTTQPDGLSGNEDCGQMSSWYVFSALGFYPVCPGSPDYIIGSPLVQNASVRLENGNTFSIDVQNQSEANIYIQSMTLNGEAYDKTYISHSDIMNGGKMKIVMGAQPNKSWGSSDNSIPVSEIKNRNTVPVPYVIGNAIAFYDTTTIRLGCADPNAKIYYTTDGSTSKESMKRYEQPILLDKTTTVKAFASGETAQSAWITSDFFSIPFKRTITLYSEYRPQYSAGGPQGLVDYLRGGIDFRTGGWQGYLTDFEAIIDLEEVRDINFISSGFLQEAKSWIWMPKAVRYSVSDDGVVFREVAEVLNTMAEDDYTVKIIDFREEFEGLKARYVRVEAENPGLIPDWHPGAGNPSFIFVDEVTVE